MCNANDQCLLGPVYSWLLYNWIESICDGWWSRCCCCCCWCCMAITLFRIRIELWWWMQFYGLYKAKRGRKKLTHTTYNTKCNMFGFFSLCILESVSCPLASFVATLSLADFIISLWSSHCNETCSYTNKQYIWSAGQSASQPTSKQQRRRRRPKKMDQQLIITF